MMIVAAPKIYPTVKASPAPDSTLESAQRIRTVTASNDDFTKNIEDM
jgi:hypothetical protein